MAPSRRCGHLCDSLHGYWFSGVIRRTMGMGDEYLVDLAHLHDTLLELVLGGLSAIKKPDIAS